MYKESSAMEQDPAAPNPAACRRVFLIDDDVTVLKAVGENLDLYGYNVSRFTSTEQFLQTCTDDQAGCVVADVRMPNGMSGLDLQRVLIDRDSMLSIVMISASSEIPQAVRAMENGAVYFLQKPFGTLELNEKVDKGIARSCAEYERRRELAPILDAYDTLTDREKEVLQMTRKGLTRDQIAAEMGRSINTVDSHCGKVLKKMGANNVIHLAHLCRNLSETLTDERD